MKSLLVSLLLVAFTQSAHAVAIELNEGQSKKLYNILAEFGLRTPYPPGMQTREWAKPAVCVKTVNSGVSYACLVHDEFHNVNVQRTGFVAKKLYQFIHGVNAPVCEGARCIVRTDDIKCAYYWPNKDNPPPRRYWCAIDKWIPIPPATN
ncbi:hypothetical protein [Pseudobdellovibrio sp. HCB154]|uniref:hypothetical protein n=1 Tax=Pseudobdellovibrio sp. HCB154 TaxID=3386277 RepID=UPI003916D64B